MLTKLWQGLGRSARIGLCTGAAAIVASTAALAWWALRTDHQVLFADLAAQDAAAMTAELERLKVPFVLGESGGDGVTILVDRKDVHATRLKIMGKDLPLRGAVGFELFNNSDFGMTEFAQRINYQRALQGELTRTILSLAEVRDARVLLALPEQGLFKAARSRATASVTLTLRPGRALSPAQVLGIQRLVAAAVPGVAAPDVTIVDQSGVALTRSGAAEEADAGSGPLNLKKETEVYLARKADEVLAGALGTGQALATVDVVLDMDRVQTTTEDVVPGPTGQGTVRTGVMVRERETVREGPPLAHASAQPGNGGAGSSQREVEYAVGRRVEQVVSRPGSIKRLHVAAVVKKRLGDSQLEAVRRLVGASVGAVPERGDTVVVQAIDAVLGPVRSDAASEAGAVMLEEGDAAPRRVEKRSAEASRAEVSPGLRRASSTAAWLLAGAAAVVIVLALRRQRTLSAPPQPLGDAERRAALAQVQGWMRASESRRVAGEGR